MSSKVSGMRTSYTATVTSGNDYGLRYTVFKSIAYASGRTAVDVRHTYNVVTTTTEWTHKPSPPHPAYATRFSSLYWRPRLERPINLSSNRVGILTSLVAEGTIRVGSLENV